MIIGFSHKNYRQFKSDFLSGAASGFCTGLLIGSTEGLKVWMQVTPPPRQYFNPQLGASLIKMTPLFAFSLSGVCALEFSFNKTVGEQYGHSAGIAASAISGAAFLTPVDHLMFRSIKNENVFQAAKTLWRASPSALWTGFTCMVIREGIFIESVAHLGPKVGQLLDKAHGTSTSDTEWAWTAAGRMSTGILTTLLSQPFDSLAREMQKKITLKDATHPLKKPSLRECMKQISRKELFRGAIPRVGLASVGGTIIGGFFDYFSSKLTPDKMTQTKPPKSPSNNL